MTTRRRLPWWRLWSVQGSFASDARQWLGWVVALDAVRPRPEEDPSRAWVDDEPRALNTNPHFFGILVGARIGIEEGEEQGRALARPITEVLPSTLGALGDRVVWTGIRPALVAVAAALVPWLGWAAALGAWIVFGIAQAVFRAWSFEWARRHGAGVAVELQNLPLHAVADRSRRVGALAVGVVTATWLVGPLSIGIEPIAGASALGVGSVLAWRRIDPLWALVAVGILAWWFGGTG